MSRYGVEKAVNLVERISELLDDIEDAVYAHLELDERDAHIHAAFVSAQYSLGWAIEEIKAYGKTPTDELEEGDKNDQT